MQCFRRCSIVFCGMYTAYVWYIVKRQPTDLRLVPANFSKQQTPFYNNPKTFEIVLRCVVRFKIKIAIFFSKLIVTARISRIMVRKNGGRRGQKNRKSDIIKLHAAAKCASGLCLASTRSEVLRVVCRMDKLGRVDKKKRIKVLRWYGAILPRGEIMKTSNYLSTFQQLHRQLATCARHALAGFSCEPSKRNQPERANYNRKKQAGKNVSFNT